MEWYYSKDKQQAGPVGSDGLIALQQAGEVAGNTLVWREGQGDWREFREVAGEVFGDAVGGSGEGGGVETAVCAYSAKVLPKSGMVPYGDAWVAPEHKDAFVQRLMEGGRMELGEEGEYGMQFMGFWWRALAALIDYFVKIIPSMLCQVPYFVASFMAAASGTQTGADDLNPLGAWTAAMVATYLLALLGQLGVSIFYDTWMVGKYQATVGKMAIGAVVVNPDGSRVGYGKSFGRWAAKKMLNNAILMAIIMIPIAVIAMVAGVGGALSEGGPVDPGALAAMVFLMFGAAAVFYPLGLFPFWMCGLDREKRTLHDRVCATRVVKKRVSV